MQQPDQPEQDDFKTLPGASEVDAMTDEEFAEALRLALQRRSSLSDFGGLS
jgi:hypothetical protein